MQNTASPATSTHSVGNCLPGSRPLHPNNRWQHRASCLSWCISPKNLDLTGWTTYSTILRQRKRIHSVIFQGAGLKRSANCTQWCCHCLILPRIPFQTAGSDPARDQKGMTNLKLCSERSVSQKAKKREKNKDPYGKCNASLKLNFWTSLRSEILRRLRCFTVS